MYAFFVLLFIVYNIHDYIITALFALSTTATFTDRYALFVSLFTAL